MGSTWMIGHDIIFDLKNQKIGIAEANCDKNDVNNKTMDEFGVEKGYKYIDNNNFRKKNFLDFLLNENLFGIYVFITFILFFVIIYLISVLINLKKQSNNPWLWFIKEKNIDKDDSFIPVRYDVNDINESQNDKEKNIDMIYLNQEEVKQEIKNSKYNKIST